ncbi:hypothetical protein QVD17_38288 [Tagetes erecta]|uniref:Uncharacterized protein n=1 Tax=Tagetes erecta TaxID=13708 RepID=A0AAD8JW80_TARER|nr:hypothetical protein QVD17_38288 [Tagetes erecta]
MLSVTDFIANQGLEQYGVAAIVKKLKERDSSVKVCELSKSSSKNSRSKGDKEEEDSVQPQCLGSPDQSGYITYGALSRRMVNSPPPVEEPQPQYRKNRKTASKSVRRGYTESFKLSAAEIADIRALGRISDDEEEMEEGHQENQGHQKAPSYVILSDDTREHFTDMSKNTRSLSDIYREGTSKIKKGKSKMDTKGPDKSVHTHSEHDSEKSLSNGEIQRRELRKMIAEEIAAAFASSRSNEESSGRSKSSRSRTQHESRTKDSHSDNEGSTTNDVKSKKAKTKKTEENDFDERRVAGTIEGIVG